MASDREAIFFVFGREYRVQRSTDGALDIRVAWRGNVSESQTRTVRTNPQEYIAKLDADMKITSQLIDGAKSEDERSELDREFMFTANFLTTIGNY
jgi:hypothetical protein